jgi:CSLREA domain-containing protein
MASMWRTTTGTIVLAIAALFCAPLLSAATITVNSTADTAANDGHCTLREAIVAANTDTASGVAVGECAAGSGADVLDLTGVSGTITLTSALPSITTDMALTGPGAANLTIWGNDLYRVFFVTNGAAVSISDLTIAHGKAVGGHGGNSDGSGGGGGSADMGGGVFVNANATLLLNSVAFTGNAASGGAGGSGGAQGDGGGGGGGIGGPGTDNFGESGGNGGGGGPLGGNGGAGATADSSGCVAPEAGTPDGAGGGGSYDGCDIDGASGSFGGGGGGGGGAGGATSAGGSGGFGGGGGGGGGNGGGGGGTFGGSGGAGEGGGGGGAGLGGAIFVRSGATLTLMGCSFQNNSGSGGTGGGSSAGGTSNGANGKGKGGAVFVMTGATASQCNTTYSANTASDAGSVSGFTNADNNDVWGTIGTITVSVSPTTLPDVTAGSPVSATFSASPAGTYTFSATGLPSWLNLATDGSLSGTPLCSDVGPVSFTVIATNSSGCSGSQLVSFNVNVLSISVSPSVLPPAFVGHSFSASFSATPAGTFTFSAIGLPGWLTLAPDGTLTGTPSISDAGLASFTVVATDSASQCTGRTVVGLQVLVAQVPTLGGIGFATLMFSLAAFGWFWSRRALP